MSKTDAEDRFNMEVGKRIEAAQEALGLSDFALAGAAEMDVKVLQVYKRGDRSMRTRRLMLLAKALHVTTDHLVGNSK